MSDAESGGSTPSYEELVALVAELRQEIEELKRQLGKNSRNSHRPPSSDFGQAQRSKSETKKKRGSNRLSARGRTKLKETLSGKRERVAEAKPTLSPSQPAVTETHAHWPRSCGKCGHTLRQCADGEAKVQEVWDVPLQPAQRHQHTLWRVRCGCGHRTRATLPPGTARWGLGPGVVAAMGMFLGGYRVSHRGCRAMLRQLWGIEVSLATVSKVASHLGEVLETPYQAALQQVRRSPVAHADETGWRVRHLKHWLWTALSRAATVFRIAPHRNKAAAAALLGEFSGVLVSDRFGAYNDYKTHWQLCLAHLSRDLIALWDFPSSPTCWKVGEHSLGALKTLFGLWHRYRAAELSRGALQRQTRPARAAFLSQMRRGARSEDKRLRGFCTTLLKQRAGLFRFLQTEEVEPTNNAAERALRTGVILRRLSLGTQSVAGTRFIERILTALATLKQRGADPWPYLQQAVRAHWTGEPVPLLTAA